MKAKEYVKKFEAELAAGKSKADACTDMLVQFLKEINVLIEIRHVKGGDALAAVFRELDNKWAAVCNLRPELPRFGFYSAVEHVMPEIWKDILWLIPELKRRENK